MCRKRGKRVRENVSQIVRWWLFISIAYSILLVLSHIFAVNNHFGIVRKILEILV